MTAGTPSADQIAERTAANRKLLADFFDGLDTDQLRTTSLCDAWTVREVLAHLATPITIGFRPFLVRVLRHRGSFNRASESLAHDLARRDVTDLTSLLRRQAGLRVPAPGVGPMGQMADGCLHLRDCARPLALASDVTLDDWRMVLDWLPTRQASLGVVPRRRLLGLRLEATDQAWSWGEGRLLTGPSEALAMAAAGRRVALADLAGDGVAVLAGRLG